MRIDDVSQLSRALAWPLVALITIALFFGPVSETLNSIAKRSDLIKEVKIGSLDLSIDENRLPQADEQTARALSGISQDAVLRLLETTSTGSTYCHPKSNTANYWIDSLNELSNRGLITFTTTSAATPGCETVYNVKSTAQGSVARQFVADFLSAILKSAPAQNTSNGTNR